MDDEKIEEFSERLLSEINGAMSCLNLNLGGRLGLFRALSDAGPSRQLMYNFRALHYRLTT